MEICVKFSRCLKLLKGWESPIMCIRTPKWGRNQMTVPCGCKLVSKLLSLNFSHVFSHRWAGTLQTIPIRDMRGHSKLNRKRGCVASCQLLCFGVLFLSPSLWPYFLTLIAVIHSSSSGWVQFAWFCPTGWKKSLFMSLEEARVLFWAHTQQRVLSRSPTQHQPESPFFHIKLSKFQPLSPFHES